MIRLMSTGPMARALAAVKSPTASTWSSTSSSAPSTSGGSVAGRPRLLTRGAPVPTAPDRLVDFALGSRRSPNVSR